MSFDQAAALRRLIDKNRPVPKGGATCEIMAITSGKGGVGKSNITLNLGLALAQQDAKVLILDADIGAANIDILLNIDPRNHLGHVIQGTHSLFQVLETITDNLSLLPGASGVEGIGEMPYDKRERFREDLAKLGETFDYLLVDTSAGVSSQVIDILKGADRIFLVCSEEPTSIVDAYALCKVLFQARPDAVVELIANKVEGETEAQDVYGKLGAAVKHFLKKELRFLSHVIHDEAITESVMNQRPLMMDAASGGAVDNFRALAQLVTHPPNWARGKGVQQLFDRLIDA